MATFIINGKPIEANSPEEAAAQASQQAPVTAAGLGKAAATGLRSGTEAIPAMGGDIPSLVGRGAGWAAGKVGLDADAMKESVATTTRAMISPGTIITKALQMAGVISPETAATLTSVQAPTSADVASVTDPAVKAVSKTAQDITRHAPQNKAEEYTTTTTSLLPAALAPGSFWARLARVVGGGTAIEGTGQATRALAPEYEEAARLVAGFLVPGAEQAAGSKAAGAFREALTKVGTNPDAVAKVEQLLREQGMSPQQISERMRDISPEAMPLDTGPNLRQEGQRIQAAGGEGRGIIDPLLRARELESNRRMMEGVGANMGPYVERDQVLNALKARGEAAGAKQKAAHPAQEQPVDSQSIIDDIDTDLAKEKSPKLRARLESIKQSLKLSDSGELDPSSEGVLSARQFLRDELYDAKTGQLKEGLGEKEAPLLQKYYKRINEALDPANPTLRAADKEIEGIKQEQNAFEKGQTVFSKEEGVQGPVSFAQEWSGLSAEQKASALQGATAKVYEKLGVFGKDRNKLNSMLVAEGKWPQEKLEMMIGAEKAGQLQKLLEGEGIMNESYQKIVQGSKTAETQPGQERPGFVKSAVNAGPDVVATSMVGGPYAGGLAATSHLKRYLTELMTSRGAPKNDAAMAKILTSTRPDDIADLVRTMKANPNQNAVPLLSALLARRQDVEERKDQ